MLGLRKVGSFSVIGVSAAGGVAHNMGQLIVACLVVQNISLAWYLPVLVIAGTITGVCMGMLCKWVMRVAKRMF